MGRLTQTSDVSHEEIRTMVLPDKLPTAVAAWMNALGQTGPSADAARRSALSDDVRLTFAGQTVVGIDAVLAHQARMPAGPAMQALEWRLLPAATATRLALRARFTGGADGRTGPNGLSALDVAFTLGDDGRIQHLEPSPHHKEPADLKPALRVGDRAPPFVLRDTSDRSTSLHGGRVPATLIVWTCNHCPWALAWHERIQNVARDYDLLVRVLQINANDPIVSPHDTLDACRHRVTAGEMASPYLMDAGQEVARAWGVRHTPEAFVLDADGRVAYHGAPDEDHRDPSRDAGWLRAALDAVLAGRDVAVPETKPVGCTVKWTLGSGPGGSER
ncbi:peroxiredoxin [Methylobacterium sp. PvP062]|mgnify:CR=1 FL=1|jgi:hypothetical protein|uniref:Thioredoxin domain-containing protein n=3 Tax=Methylobacterium TaxID=407 RepID=A0AA37WVX0_9HYPH|nr:MULTISPECIES: thioredoxin family protein [Methylobacterium]MCX7334649.1 thioredoxin family protein [Hyphomicrobiales bacterium]MBP2498054.1 peroxiredoxin [Methylobacterium sp. PvP105]MBP2502075.1 peroxiredoxin [Methylobacterium sp. PvP109]MDE3749883.1 thioredoxin family protein [Methylobacterium radiotolerans]MWV20698.1 thioredoxin family protein [Methylobacterium sp. 2A]